MNKKILVIIFCVVVCLAGLIYAYTLQNVKLNDSDNNTLENTTQKNIQENKEQKQPLNTGKENNVIATQKGPDKPQKRGTNVPIYCTITNRGDNTIYNVKAWSQSFNKNIGTLKPGESKKFTYVEYIPTDSDMETDMPGSGPLPNPYDIGGFEITFKDAKGVVHKVTSNSIEIKWFD